MNKKEILSCIKANKKISDYELKIVNKDSRELFYVLDHLEISRAVKTQSVVINVYVSDQKTLGSSIVSVTSADDEKSLNKKLNEAVKKADAARNNYYPLANKKENIVDKKPKAIDLNLLASNIAQAVLKADVYKDGWINSTEIFVSTYETEFINSKGIKHKTYSFSYQVECIPTWRNGKEEFELYKFIESNKVDYKKITNDIEEILNLAKDRSLAIKPKKLKLPKDLLVLVKDDMLETIVGNLCSEFAYKKIFVKQNHYNNKDKVSNTSFDLTMKGQINGASKSKKFDGNGVILKSKKIIDKGIAKGSFGDIQFGHYLNVKNITGNYPVCELKANETYDYTKEKHLIIENFSSPQLEENSGYFGGEVRLAKYFDGEKYIPLTGFSISGSIYKDFLDVKFSKEITTSSAYKGPKYLIFKGIEIH